MAPEFKEIDMLMYSSHIRLFFCLKRHPSSLEKYPNPLKNTAEVGS